MPPSPCTLPDPNCSSRPVRLGVAIKPRNLDEPKQKPKIRPTEFHVLFTLTSKFFSSFPHGTFALSVFRSYLALGGAYLPILFLNSDKNDSSNRVRAEFIGKACTGISPSLKLRSPQTYPFLSPEAPSLDYTSPPETDGDFQIELFPLHSPLLGESLLFSFPRLNKMLQFRRFSCLIWVLKG